MKDKRKGKLDKHFHIIIEDKKVPILSYKISGQGERRILSVKTMIKSEIIPRLIGRPTKVSISTEKSVINILGECYLFAHFSPLYEIEFRIIEISESVF
ncbi:hypothetical protein LI073_00770 [bacterium 210917-SL.2.15]|nr:hypothetical protein [bacterium 210917-SL.2.15]